MSRIHHLHECPIFFPICAFFLVLLVPALYLHYIPYILPSGKPIFPIVLGGLTVHSLGEVRSMNPPFYIHSHVHCGQIACPTVSKLNYGNKDGT